jgi:hypothetical protein
VLHHREAALATVIISRYPIFEDHCTASFVLERGHALQRQICTRPLRAKRGRRVEEFIAPCGALTLLRYGLEYGASAVSTQ